MKRPSFGDVAVELGFVTRDQIRHAKAFAIEAKLGTLGEALVKLDYLTVEQAGQVLTGTRADGGGEGKGVSRVVLTIDPGASQDESTEKELFVNTEVLPPPRKSD